MFEHSDRNVSMVLEVSHGCQYSCAGCTVNKNTSKLPTIDEEKEILDFVADIERNGCGLSELEIGPTDILSAINRDEILSSNILKSLAPKYSMLTFIAGMTYPDKSQYYRLAEQINNLTDGSQLKERSFFVPFELSHATNKKYIDTIVENATILIDNVRAEKGQIILQVNFDARLLTQKRIGQKSWKELFAAVHQVKFPKYKTLVNIALPHGRKPLDDKPSSDNFRDSLELMNEYYSEFMVNSGLEGRVTHLPYQLLYDRFSSEVLWHSGELYIRSMLNERFTSLTADRLFHKPWTQHSLAVREAELITEDMEFALSLKDCSACEYINTCSKRGIHEVMRTAKTDKCIMLLPKFGSIAGSLQRGEYDKIDWKQYARK